MAFVVTGVEGSVLRKSIFLRHEVQSRAVLDFDVIDDDEVTPTIGAEVSVSDGSSVLFSGHVWQHDAKPIPGTAKWRTQISCVDHRWLVDRRVVNIEYPEPGTAVLVADIIDEIASECGVDTGTIQVTGSLERPVQYLSSYAFEVLNELADFTNCFWGVDKDKKLFFHKKDTVAGPTLQDSDLLEVTIGTDNSSYFDKVHLTNTRFYYEIEDRLARSFINGNRTRFPLLRPVARRGMTSAGFTFGEADVETGKDFYYRIGQSEVVQDESGTPLTMADFDDFIPTYDAREPVTVTVGTGAVERVIDGSRVQFDDAAAVGQALIDKYGNPLQTIRFSTYEALEAGTWCTIGTFGTFLITRSAAEDPGRADKALLRTYYGVDQEPLNNAVQFFERWQRNAVAQQLESQEVVS